MQQVDGDLVVSATDLTRFLACRHLTRLDLEVARGLRSAPVEHDPAAEVLFRRGRQHEAAYLERLRRGGATVAEITVDPGPPLSQALRAAEAATVAAMASGVDVVYQATFFADGRRGHADLLLKRSDRPGRWPWSYDVADTKLARRPTVGALLQMSVYAERLAVLQGVPPENLVVVTGDGVERPVPFDRCAQYARGVQAALEDFLRDPPATDPRPVRHCARCRWRPECRARWAAEDRLSLVAQLRDRHAQELESAGITTLTALAAADPADLPDGVPPDVAERIVVQARLQLAERAGAGPQHRLLPAEPGRGLALLPPPSPGDVFFDIEGDPHVGERGLEYLFGVVVRGEYTAYWATNEAAERAAFEALVDRLVEEGDRDPGMHVYHYAPYEPSRLEALAGRYDTRVAEVERLLRGERLVDLYRVVKQGVQVGKESYSLKRLEDHYWGRGRDGAGVGDALGSVVAFERWLLTDPADATREALLESIRAYNEVDCRSTEALRDWLEGLRRDGGGGAVFPRPAQFREARPPARDRAGRSAALRAALLDGGPGEADRVLAALVDWHRREALSGWADPAGGHFAAEEHPILAGQLAELAGWVAEHGVDAPLPGWRAARDLLLRRPPAGGAPVVEAGETVGDAVVRFARADGGARLLVVQGRPGAGRSAAAARAVLAAVQAGLRVGVCAPGRAAIDGVVREVAAGARRAGLPLRAVRQAEPGRAPGDPDVARVTGARQAAGTLRGGRAHVVVGPPELFAHPALRDHLDLLVVDDVGRAPLADVLTAAGSARRLLLLGDRPESSGAGRGAHPPGAAVSALEYLLAGRATIAPADGVLLDTTRPMHPDVARFLSTLSPGGRLVTPAGCERMRVRSAGPLSGAGLRWVPAHGDDASHVVTALVQAVLADGRWTDRGGVEAPLLPRDVVVLAPSDEQVRRLRRAITAAGGAGPALGAVRVGTIDAFPDVEAPVVVYDLAGAGLPGVGRDVRAVLQGHRLAPVLARAGALVAVVAAPALLVAPASDLRQVHELDALCRFAATAVTLVSPVPVASAAPPPVPVAARSPVFGESGVPSSW